MSIPKIQLVIKKKEQPVAATETNFSLGPVPANAVLSFDVAIKTLAYAVVGPGPVVYDWALINLTSEELETTCTATLKSKAPCTNRAACFMGIKSTCFCNVHRPTGAIDFSNGLLCSAVTKTGTKCERHAHDYLEASSGAREGFCSIHSKPGSTRFYTVENMTDTEIRVRLFQELDRRPLLQTVSTILIEHQPNHATEKVKSIAYALHDYFVLRCVLEGHNRTIKSVDARNKLTTYGGPPLSCPLTNQYDRNKWYSIRYCQWNLRNSTVLLKYFNSFHKQDDLADSMLQGIWYLSGSKGGGHATMTNHQQLVYREQNLLKLKKIKAVKPTTKRIGKGRLTLSNIKWALDRNQTQIAGLLSSIKYYFGVDSVDALRSN